jgi:hypothetical protein
VRHVRAGFQVGAVCVGGAQPVCGQLDGDQGDGVVERLVVIAGVALDPVRERVHSGSGGDRWREAEHEGGVHESDVRPDQGRPADVELDLALVVGDDGPQRNLASGPRRRRHRD